MTKRKTGKRETAWAMLLLLAVASVYAVAPSDAGLVSARVELIRVLATPIIAFAAFAYGAQWVSQQTNWGGPPASEIPPDDGEDYAARTR